jgi:hypothetical protein
LETEAVKKVSEKSLRKKCDQIVAISPNKKSPDFWNLGFFMPKIVVTRLGVEPRTY